MQLSISKKKSIAPKQKDGAYEESSNQQPKFPRSFFQKTKNIMMFLKNFLQKRKKTAANFK